MGCFWGLGGPGREVRCREGLRGPFRIVKLVFLLSFSFHVFILLNTLLEEAGDKDVIVGSW